MCWCCNGVDKSLRVVVLGEAYKARRAIKLCLFKLSGTDTQSPFGGCLPLRRESGAGTGLWLGLVGWWVCEVAGSALLCSGIILARGVRCLLSITATDSLFSPQVPERIGGSLADPSRPLARGDRRL